MIQRIQSLYLVLAALCLAGLFWFPLASMTPGREAADQAVYIYSLSSTEVIRDGMRAELKAHTAQLILAGIALMVIIWSFLQFKDRPLQIKLSGLAFLLVLGLIILASSTISGLREMTLNKHNLLVSFGAIFPFAALVFLWMATAAIRKDEKLVRSSDRLR